ncbi:hypothetical protein OG21DRAFT_513232 [Imleria badia]|nr:hypothetical protein OG21DRAFT_513232 [Imleria badia]
MVLLALPPTMDCPPESCFCGRKTVKSHDFWFCSTKCARQDSLRSLDNRECHYRTVVRDAYDRAGAPELRPRRTASTVHLRTGPSDRRGFSNVPPPPLPPTNLPQQQDETIASLERLAILDENLRTFPFPTGETAAERIIRSKRDRLRHTPRLAHPVTRPGDHPVQHINLNAIPLPEAVPARSLRRAPSSIDVLKSNTKKSPMSALLNFGRSRKGKEVDNTERIFGHPVNTIAPPGRQEVRKGRIL